MKASFKRLVSLLLVLVMVFGVVPSVSAEEIQGVAESVTTSNDPPTEATKSEETEPETTENKIDPEEETVPEEEVYWLDTIDKGESALTVVYDEYFTEEQLAQMPSVMAAETRASHGSHRQACNIWLSGKRLTYEYPEGVKKTVDSVALHRVYNSKTGNWEVAFCLEPGVANASSGYVDGQYSTEATWGNLDKNQQAAIGLAILYGAPNNPDLKTSDTRRMLAYELATYVIVHEIILGWRNSTGTYACTNSAYINAFGKGNLEITSGYYPEVDGEYLRTSAWTSGESDEVMDAYNYISAKMAKHNIIPSFASDRSTAAPTHPLTKSGTKWTTTLTDTNNILSEYSFTNTSNLTFSVSGNKLTVTAKGKGPYKAIAPTRVLPNITTSGSVFRIWKTSTGAQDIITVASSRKDPVPAYFNLGPSTGAITGTKMTEDGANLSGWTIQLKSGNTVIATTTTDSKGNFSFTDIPEGTYTIHEEISSTSKYYCVKNDQTVTVTAGDTASVTVNNNLKRGNISGVKNTETGTDKKGWTIQLKSGSTVVATTTTDANGKFSFKDIPIGTYTLHEVVPADSKYYCAKNDIEVKVTYNTTVTAPAIENKLKRGNISGTKNTDTGTDKKGWTIQLKSGSTVIATTTTDANGKFSFKDIPIGKYTVHEEVPNGSKYICTVNDAAVTVTYNGTANVAIENKLIRAHIQLNKVDTDTEALLSGAVFEVTDSHGKKHTMSEISAGVYRVENIPYGKATIKELTAPSGHVLNTEVFTVNITENGKTYSVSSSGFNGVANEPVPGSGAASKTSTNGISAEGYALAIWTDRTGRVGETTHYLKSDSNGIFYVTDSAFATVTDTRNYKISGIYDGNYSIKELISKSDYQEAYPESIRVVVTNSSGETSLDKTFAKEELEAETVNGVTDYATPQFAVTGLNGGGEMTVYVVNHPIPGTATVKKITTDEGYLDGYAVKFHQSNSVQTDGTVYLRSDETGSFYITDSDYSEVTENKNYTISNVYDGTFAIRELIENSTWHHEKLDAVKITIKDKNGTETYNRTFTGDELAQENKDYILADIPLSGINGGGNLNIEIINTPVAGQITVNKTNRGNEPLAGAKFLLEWSKDGTTWTAVAVNDTDKITIGGCQSEGLVDGCLISDEDGLIEFVGLHPMMQYRVTELEAPNGYTMLADHAFIGTLEEQYDYELSLTVVNTAAYELPAAGSYGMGVLPPLGILMIGFALLLLFCSMQKRPQIVSDATNGFAVGNKQQKERKLSR